MSETATKRLWHYDCPNCAACQAALAPVVPAQPSTEEESDA